MPSLGTRQAAKDVLLSTSKDFCLSVRRNLEAIPYKLTVKMTKLIFKEHQPIVHELVALALYWAIIVQYC